MLLDIKDIFTKETTFISFRIISKSNVKFLSRFHDCVSVRLANREMGTEFGNTVGQENGREVKLQR